MERGACNHFAIDLDHEKVTNVFVELNQATVKHIALVREFID
jgi:hypothetical protein